MNDAHPKTICVSGCAGFIGGAFTRAVRKRYPDTVILGIDDFSEGRREIAEGVTFHEGSILDATLLETLFTTYRPEYVFHFAARPRVSFSIKNPALSAEVNIVGTVRLLEASVAAGVKRFIFSSSSSVYGQVDTLPASEATHSSNPQSPYALEKYASEHFCKQFSTLFNLDTVCLRYFTAYGPGQYGDAPYMTVIAAWLESLYFPSEKKGFIEGDGTQSRDFAYIDDIIEANLLAMASPRVFGGEIINVAAGQGYEINDIRSRIEKRSGKKLDLEQRPERLGDVRHTLADITKAKELIGFVPKVSLDEGLDRTIAWFEERAW